MVTCMDRPHDRPTGWCAVHCCATDLCAGPSGCVEGHPWIYPIAFVHGVAMLLFYISKQRHSAILFDGAWSIV